MWPWHVVSTTGRHSTRSLTAVEEVRRIYAKRSVNTLGGAVARAIRDGIV
jgi:hypothetical protein